jgi:hypothetical protein
LRVHNISTVLSHCRPSWDLYTKQHIPTFGRTASIKECSKTLSLLAYVLRNSSGNLTIFTAIRLASSFVNSLVVILTSGFSLIYASALADGSCNTAHAVDVRKRS